VKVRVPAAKKVLAGQFGPPPSRSSNDGGNGCDSDVRPEQLGAMITEIEAALDSFSAPAYVVDRSGTVLIESAAARVLDRRETEGLVSAVRRWRSPEEAWQLRPLRGGQGLVGFIAVLRDLRESGGVNDREVIYRPWKLTARQAQVADLVAHGHTNAFIADTLGISESTVEFHLAAVFDKAGVNSRARLILKLLELRQG
jgi:DNA-binding NarL/FixJ family response regulator